MASPSHVPQQTLHASCIYVSGGVKAVPGWGSQTLFLYCQDAANAGCDATCQLGAPGGPPSHLVTLIPKEQRARASLIGRETPLFIGTS